MSFQTLLEGKLVHCFARMTRKLVHCLARMTRKLVHCLARMTRKLVHCLARMTRTGWVYVTCKRVPTPFKASAVSLSKNFNHHCSVLFGSMNGFERDLNNQNFLFHNQTIINKAMTKHYWFNYDFSFIYEDRMTLYFY